jgi:hypothetical protein
MLGCIQPTLQRSSYSLGRVIRFSVHLHSYPSQ